MSFRIALSVALAATLLCLTGCGDEKTPPEKGKTPAENTTAPNGDGEQPSPNPNGTTGGEMPQGTQQNQTQPDNINENPTNQTPGATTNPRPGQQGQPQNNTGQQTTPNKGTGNQSDTAVPVPEKHPDVKKETESESESEANSGTDSL